MPNMDPRCRQIVTIAGMPRSATTFLYHNLQKHPGVIVPFRKEVEFFSFNLDRGIPWYLDHFTGLEEGKVGFDISPKYFWLEDVVDRIKNMNPEARVILGIRDPAEVALSLYAQRSMQSFRMPEFRHFMNEFTLRRGGRAMRVRLSAHRMKEMMEHYCGGLGDNLLLYSFALVRRDPLRLLKAIERFSGLAAFFDEERYDRVVVNAASRRNSRLVSWLLSREPVIHLIQRLVPATLVRRLRGAFDQASGQKDYRPRPYRPEDVALAQEVLREDRAYVDGFFGDRLLRLGSGSPFDEG